MASRSLDSSYLPFSTSERKFCSFLVFHIDLLTVYMIVLTVLISVRMFSCFIPPICISLIIAFDTSPVNSFLESVNVMMVSAASPSIIVSTNSCPLSGHSSFAILHFSGILFSVHWCVCPLSFVPYIVLIICCRCVLAPFSLYASSIPSLPTRRA